MIQDALLLWATVDPVGTLAIFAAVTAHLDPAARRRLALKSTLYSAVILLGAMFAGQFLLSGMGIRLVSLQVAGGIILFIFGLKMVFGETFAGPAGAHEDGRDLAVFPLAVPAIASPGAIIAAILLTDNYVFPLRVQAATAAVLLLVLGATCLLMLFSDLVLRFIGRNGASIAVRVMGLVLAALSVELVMRALGVRPWLHEVP